MDALITGFADSYYTSKRVSPFAKEQ